MFFAQSCIVFLCKKEKQRLFFNFYFIQKICVLNTFVCILHIQFFFSLEFYLLNERRRRLFNAFRVSSNFSPKISPFFYWSETLKTLAESNIKQRKPGQKFNWLDKIAKNVYCIISKDQIKETYFFAFATQTSNWFIFFFKLPGYGAGHFRPAW